MALHMVHHIAIIASHYEVSKDFYVNKLGFSILQEHHRPDRKDYKLDLQLGNCQLELFGMPNSPPRPTNPEACGLRHIAFFVESVEDTVAELQQKGITTEPIRIDTYTNKPYTFFKDPDGLPLELHE